jgi:hypothetical protein
MLGILISALVLTHSGHSVTDMDDTRNHDEEHRPSLTVRWFAIYCGCKLDTGLPSGIVVRGNFDACLESSWTEYQIDSMRIEESCGIVRNIAWDLDETMSVVKDKIQWPSAKTGAEYAKWWKESVLACKLEVYGKYYMCPDGDPAALRKAKNPRDNCFDTAKKARDQYDADAQNDPKLLKSLRDNFLKCLVAKGVLKKEDIEKLKFGEDGKK